MVLRQQNATEEIAEVKERLTELARHLVVLQRQDSSEEIRAWTCVTVIPGRLTGCTTHLSTDPDVAMGQCKELISTLASPWVMPDVIVAGDLNLKYLPGRPHNVRDCAPALPAWKRELPACDASSDWKSEKRSGDALITLASPEPHAMPRIGGRPPSPTAQIRSPRRAASLVPRSMHGQ